MMGVESRDARVSGLAPAKFLEKVAENEFSSSTSLITIAVILGLSESVLSEWEEGMSESFPHFHLSRSPSKWHPSLF